MVAEARNGSNFKSAALIVFAEIAPRSSHTRVRSQIGL